MISTDTSLSLTTTYSPTAVLVDRHPVGSLDRPSCDGVDAADARPVETLVQVRCQLQPVARVLQEAVFARCCAAVVVRCGLVKSLGTCRG